MLQQPSARVKFKPCQKKLVPLSDAVDFQIYRLSTLLDRELRKALKSYKLSPEKWQVLATLWQAEEPVTQTDLAELTWKDKPSISRLVSSMIKEGWVLRANDTQDARAYKIKPSHKALKKQNEIVQSLYSHFEKFHEKFGSKNKDQLLKLTSQYTNVVRDVGGASHKVGE